MERKPENDSVNLEVIIKTPDFQEVQIVTCIKADIFKENFRELVHLAARKAAATLIQELDKNYNSRKE